MVNNWTSLFYWHGSLLSLFSQFDATGAKILTSSWMGNKLPGSAYQLVTSPLYCRPSFARCDYFMPWHSPNIMWSRYKDIWYNKEYSAPTGYKPGNNVNFASCSASHLTLTIQGITLACCSCHRDHLPFIDLSANYAPSGLRKRKPYEPTKSR